MERDIFACEKGEFLVETYVYEAGRPGVRGSDPLSQISKFKMQDISRGLLDVSTALADALVKLPNRPVETEIEMGLTLSADAGVVVAKVGSEAHLKVKLVWKSIDESAGS